MKVKSEVTRRRNEIISQRIEIRRQCTYGAPRQVVETMYGVLRFILPSPRVYRGMAQGSLHIINGTGLAERFVLFVGRAFEVIFPSRTLVWRRVICIHFQFILLSTKRKGKYHPTTNGGLRPKSSTIGISSLVKKNYSAKERHRCVELSYSLYD